MNRDSANTKWVLHPVCGNKTRTKVYDDTMVLNFPLYCPKCKKEVRVDIVPLIPSRITLYTRVQVSPAAHKSPVGVLSADSEAVLRRCLGTGSSLFCPVPTESS